MAESVADETKPTWGSVTMPRKTATGKTTNGLTKTARRPKTKTRPTYPVGTRLTVKTGLGLSRRRGFVRMGSSRPVTVVTNGARWTRVFDLRRALIPYILLAGERAPLPGEDGPQKFVCLSDDFDDVLYAALDREARGAR